MSKINSRCDKFVRIDMEEGNMYMEFNCPNGKVVLNPSRYSVLKDELDELTSMLQKVTFEDVEINYKKHIGGYVFVSLNCAKKCICLNN